MFLVQPANLKLFQEAGLSFTDVLQLIDGDPEVGDSDGRVPTRDELLKSIMDEGILNLERGEIKVRWEGVGGDGRGWEGESGRK